MCIIVIKPAGIALPGDEILETCYLNNPDGAGFMWAVDGTVHIRKGYMTYATFRTALATVTKKIDTVATPMVLHFRIGTIGGNTPQNCHPFPITGSLKALQKLEISVPLAIAHNGTIDVIPRQKDISDTMEYILNQLAPLYKLRRDFYKVQAGRDLVYNAIASKMIFLDKYGRIETVGEFIEKDGLLYSNSSYLPYYGYSKWDIWDDYLATPNVKALMWLEDTDGYIVRSDGEMECADNYLMDHAGGIYSYNYASDTAYLMNASIVSHTQGQVEFNIARAEFLPVATGTGGKKKKKGLKKYCT